MLLGKIGSEHIESGEHPATARLLLIVNRLLGSLNTEISVNGALVGKVARQIVDVVRGNGIEKSLTRFSIWLCFLDTLQHFRGYSAFGRLANCRARNKEQGYGNRVCTYYD